MDSLLNWSNCDQKIYGFNIIILTVFLFNIRDVFSGQSTVIWKVLISRCTTKRILKRRDGLSNTQRGGTGGILVYRTYFVQPYNQSLAGSKYINNTVCHIAGDSIHLIVIGSNDYIYICHTIQSGFDGSERTHYILNNEPSHSVCLWKVIKIKEPIFDSFIFLFTPQVKIWPFDSKHVTLRKYNLTPISIKWEIHRVNGLTRFWDKIK